MPPLLRRDLLLLPLVFVALLAWDASGADLVLVHWYGSAAGFAWRDHWLTATLAHEGGRLAAQATLVALIVNVWRPLPFARGLARRERVIWLAGTVFVAVLVPLVKRHSLTSCPWSLAEFGGVAHYVSHWRWGVADGGDGGCFPSGHASAAFALLTGGYALAAHHARAARRWTLAVLLAAAAFGWAQWARGAHYPSHTLWAGWICWAGAAAWHHAWSWRQAAGRQPLVKSSFGSSTEVRTSSSASSV